MSKLIRALARRARTFALGLHQRTTSAYANGHTFQLALNSYMDWSRARTFSTKEPDTLHWIEQYCRSGDIFYDVGANIGVFSLYAARYVAPHGRVQSFEPEALNFAQLNKNVALNRLGGVVQTHCLAVGDRTGMDELFFHPQHLPSGGPSSGLSSGTALHAIGNPTDHTGQKFEAAHRQGVFCVSLDALWSDYALPFPNHIKIDVDGGEGRIMRGAQNTIRDPRLRSLLVECSDAAFVSSLSTNLATLGFSRITLEAAPTGRVFSNAIFAR